jgi:hypothetical protein
MNKGFFFSAVVVSLLGNNIIGQRKEGTLCVG